MPDPTEHPQFPETQGQPASDGAVPPAPSGAVPPMPADAATASAGTVPPTSAAAPPGPKPADAETPAPVTWQYVEPVAPVVANPARERRRLSVIVGVGAAFVLLALVSAVALSAPNRPSVTLTAGTSTSQTATPTPTPRPGIGSQACQDMLSNLASRLNVSVQTLQQAITGAAGDTIDQLVQQGKLTQDQANRLKSALSNDTSPCAYGRFGFGLGPLGGDRPFAGGPGTAGPGIGLGPLRGDAATILDAAAKALKLDTQTLLSSLRQGQDLKTIAQKQGVAYSTVTSAITSAVKTQLDVLVAKGTITATQETAILDRLNQQLANGQLGFGFGLRGMPGVFGEGPMMHGGFGWRGGAQPGAPTPTPTPVTPSSQG